MKLLCSLFGVADIKHPRRTILQLKELGFDGVAVNEAAFGKKENLSEFIDHVKDFGDKESVICRMISQDILTDYSEKTKLFQNQCRVYHGHYLRGPYSDPYEVVETIDCLNEEAGKEAYGFGLDVGVCNLCGQNMYDFVMTLGHRLKAVILRDNDGNSDDHLLPFSCAHQGQSRTDWLNLIRGLRELEFDGDLIMSIGDSVAAASVTLRPAVLELAYKQAQYFQWQIQMTCVMKKYSSRVLFGAGNMCRNYMKCYGQEFPPLFTCDNNENRWGEIFEGLEIRSPEELKNLSPDCAIFICIMYYDDIEKQLRDMGITNPIERFNDEFMPSFHWKRLEMWEEGHA